MTRQEIELVPVDDEKAPSVGKFVDGVFSDFNPPEKQPGISADEIVVVAWNVGDLGPGTRVVEFLRCHCAGGPGRRIGPHRAPDECAHVQ